MVAALLTSEGRPQGWRIVESREFGHGELTLGHPEVLDVGGGAVEKRNLARLLVGDGKGVLETATTLSEFVAPTLL